MAFSGRYRTWLPRAGPALGAAVRRPSLIVTPATKTLAYVAMFAGVFLAYRSIAHWDTAEGIEDDFDLWLVVASFVTVVFVGNLVAGIRDWRELARLSPASTTVKAWNVVLAVVLGAGVWWMLRRAGSEQFEVPLVHWDTLRNTVFAVGAASAAPRVAAIWTAHDTLGRIKQPEPDPNAGSPSTPDAASRIDLLAALHAHIERSIIGLSVVVLGAMVTSGALRESLLGGGHIEPEDFPPGAVVGYGVFFAAIIAIAVVPLLLSWRQAAQAALEADESRGETAEPPSPEATRARSRLESALSSEESLFRSPLVLVSVLTPILTSAVTALIPKLS